MTDRQQEYIRLLQERNRLKKMMNEKSDEQLMQEELERGFSTHFRGAHAAKEKTPNSKIGGKPQVKINKHAQLDIAKRLNPLYKANNESPTRSEGDHSGGENSSPGMEENENDMGNLSSRTGSSQKAPGRYSSQYLEDEEEYQNFEYENGQQTTVDSFEHEASSTNRITPTSSTPNIKKPNSASASDNIDLTTLLQSQINTMSEEQKLALFELLQFTAPNSSKPSTSSGPSRTRDNDGNIAMRGKYDDNAVADNNSTNIQQDQTHNNNTMTSPIRTSPLRSKLMSEIPVIATIPVNLKIKIYSTWQMNSKNVGLQGLRLRLILPPLEKGHQRVDCLSLLIPKLCCGLSTLPMNSEAMKTLNDLLGIGFGKSGSVWKAPIASTNPLEMRFTGCLSSSIIKLFQDTYPNFTPQDLPKEILHYLELSIWNGQNQENGSFSGINASPAKDVDVYIDDKCIWTGELSSISGSLPTIDKSSNDIYFLSRLESDPSLQIKLTGQSSAKIVNKPMTAASEARNDLRISTTHNDQEGIVRDSLSEGLISSSRKAIGIATSNNNLHPVVNNGLGSNTANEKPSWLTANSSSNNTSAPPTATQRKMSFENILLDNPNVPKERENAINFDDEDVPTATPKKPVSHSRRRRIPGGAANENNNYPASSGINASNNFPKSSEKGSRSQPSEQDLRKSLDAVQHAETKFNLNRIESTIQQSGGANSAHRRSRRQLLFDSEGGNHSNIDLESSVGSVMSFASQPNTSRVPTASAKDQGNSGRMTADSSSGKLAATINTVTTLGDSTVGDESQSQNNDGELPELSPSASHMKQGVDLTSLETSKQTITVAVPSAPPQNNSQSSNTSVSGSTNSSKNPPLAIDPSTLSLPQGQCLELRIFSTYGDMNYVGLNGVEIFDEKGRLVRTLAADGNIQSIGAHPSDLSVLPGYEDDPRKVENLLDGINDTKDDLHQWLAPQLHVLQNDNASNPVNENDPICIVTIKFSSPQRISMMKVFNFNKSRTHNQRGVRKCIICLDNQEIFSGEIKKATAAQTKASNQEDFHLISFTSDQELINQIYPSPSSKPMDTNDQMDLEDSVASIDLRPKTSVARNSTTTNQITAPVINNNQNLVSSPKRRKSLQNDSNDTADEPTVRKEQSGGTPFQSQIDNVLDEIHELTSFTRGGIGSSPKRDKQDKLRNSQNRPPMDPMQNANTSSKSQSSSSKGGNYLHNTLPARKIKIILEDTWEKGMDYLGLTGFEVLDGKGQVIAVKHHNLVYDATLQMTASTFPDRPITNLFAAPFTTTRETSMWMIPSYPNTPLEIDFQDKVQIAGIRVWNYNGQQENVLRGIKHITIHLDNKLYFRTLLRMAPGFDGVEFVQTIYFDHLADIIQRVIQQQKEKKQIQGIDSVRPTAYLTPKIKQVYEIVQVPCGLSYKICFYNNHGDDYYVGLDHIDLYDVDNKVIDLAAYGGYLSAIPYSVQDLSTSEDDTYGQDPRIPEQLFNPAFHQIQPNNNNNSSNVSWLCPLAYCMSDIERQSCVKRLLSSTAQSGGIFPKLNTLYIHFAYPVSIAAIRMYNYSKTPKRGAREFAIHVDEKIVYMGSLRPANEETVLPVNRQPPLVMKSQGQAVVFSSDMKVVNSHKDFIAPVNANGDQDVLCINERQVMVRSKTMYEHNAAVDLQKRPTTSFFS